MRSLPLVLLVGAAACRGPYVAIDAGERIGCTNDPDPFLDVCFGSTVLTASDPQRPSTRFTGRVTAPRGEPTFNLSLPCSATEDLVVLEIEQEDGGLWWLGFSTGASTPPVQFGAGDEVDVLIHQSIGPFSGGPAFSLTKNGALVFALDVSSTLVAEDFGGVQVGHGTSLNAEEAFCGIAVGETRTLFQKGAASVELARGECGLLEDERGALHVMPIESSRSCPSPDGFDPLTWMSWR